MRNISSIIIILFLLHVLHSISYAVTISVNNLPNSIGSDPFSLNVTVDGASPGTNYLRVDLYKEGSMNYFGETNNNSIWYSGSLGMQYLPLTIDESQIATASVQARVGTPTQSEYDGPGSYKLRIRRYTSSGNPASGDTQTPQDIQITVPLASPTPTPQPSPTLVPTPNPTPKPTPVLVPTPKPTPKPSVTPTPFPKASEDVLGEMQEIVPSASPEVKGVANTSFQFPVGILFIVAGALFSGAGGFLAFQRFQASGFKP